MPELAEVAYFASQWTAAAGERFSLERLNERARCCRPLEPRQIKDCLKDCRLLEGRTHGKRMLFSFEGGRFVEVHLGMSGALRREESGAALEKHDHFVLGSDRSQLVFRDPRQFGRLALHQSESGWPEWWKQLPPQPHEGAFNRARFASLCSGRERAQAKPFLLDQAAFPGVGNWMADEILWQARIRPDRTLGSLSEEEKDALYGKLRAVCRGALRTVGEDYRDPPKSWLFRHRWRPGGLCPKTGEPLARTSVGGRTTCWSPAWQR